MKKAAYIHTPNSSKLTYCVFTASKDYDDGIVSLDGEELIRPKYYILQPIDDNLIIAKKNDKYGIIDINEQKIIGFKYDGLQLLGDNIFVLDDGDYYIIDRKGKRIGKDTYARRSDFQCDQVVHYVNVDNEVRLIDNAIKDYTNGAKVSTIAQKTHVTPSEALQYTSVLTADEWTIGNMRINISYNFSDGVVTPRTHQVTHNDGWWEWTETVVDSWQWSDATLYNMTIAFDYSNVSGLDADDALEYLRSALLQHGFEEHVGNNVYGKYNKELSLSAETRQENKLFVFITDMIR